MAKRKCWYKNIKEGDFLEVNLKGNFSAHMFSKEVVILQVVNRHLDGDLHLVGNNLYHVNIGFEGTDWAEKYPANIIRKVKGFDS